MTTGKTSQTGILSVAKNLRRFFVASLLRMTVSNILH
jgi:hypothetical protein